MDKAGKNNFPLIQIHVKLRSLLQLIIKRGEQTVKVNQITRENNIWYLVVDKATISHIHVGIICTYSYFIM